MSSDSKIYVQSCPVCNKNKKANVKAKAELGQYHAGMPMERIHMDILGPLPLSKKGNKYVLVLIDQLTKWLECFPLPSQNAELVAKVAVDGFFSRFGCPLELHTDQGKNMDGNMIRSLCDLLQIAKTRTTPYRPCSNGQVERYNRVILQTIRCYLRGNQGEWDRFLQQISGAIRATIHRQTGFTPNRMMLGREVLQPIDILLGTSRIHSLDENIQQYVQNLQSNLENIHKVVRENLQSTQERQKRDYDLRTNQRSYEVGDVVLKIDSATKIGQSSKLKPPWKGPFIISEVISPVLYKVRDRKKESVIHHDRLKICKDRNFPLWLLRLRNKIMKGTVQRNIDRETEDLGLSHLFSESIKGNSDSVSDALIQSQSCSGIDVDSSQDRGLVSDSLISDQTHIHHDPPSLSNPDLMSDVLMSDQNNDVYRRTEANAEMDENSHRQVVTDLQMIPERDELAEDADATFCYQAEDNLVQAAQNRTKRTRKKPLYLDDFVP